ncbi:hypothetical protein MTO96_027910 [Rhipicephalus appendiculatus]
MPLPQGTLGGRGNGTGTGARQGLSEVRNVQRFPPFPLGISDCSPQACPQPEGHPPSLLHAPGNTAPPCQPDSRRGGLPDRPVKGCSPPYQGLDHCRSACGPHGPFQCCAVRIRLDGEDTAVASVYIRPCRPWDPRCPRQLAHRLGKDFLLCGDVNAHHPAWGGRKTDPRGREVRDILQQLGLVILNTGAVTYLRRGAQATSTAIDLSVATEGCQYAWSPFPDTWGSDHRPILLTPFRGKVPRDREYRVVDWRVYRQLFKQDTGGTDLLQLVADNARAATVVAKVPQGKPAPDIQHLALRAARRRAERQVLKRTQPELWTVFRKVDAVCRRHANRRRNQGYG